MKHETILCNGCECELSVSSSPFRKPFSPTFEKRLHLMDIDLCPKCWDAFCANIDERRKPPTVEPWVADAAIREAFRERQPTTGKGEG